MVTTATLFGVALASIFADVVLYILIQNPDSRTKRLISIRTVLVLAVAVWVASLLRCS